MGERGPGPALRIFSSSASALRRTSAASLALALLCPPSAADKALLAPCARCKACRCASAVPAAASALAAARRASSRQRLTSRSASRTAPRAALSSAASSVSFFPPPAVKRLVALLVSRSSLPVEAISRGSADESARARPHRRCRADQGRSRTTPHTSWAEAGLGGAVRARAGSRHSRRRRSTLERAVRARATDSAAAAASDSATASTANAHGPTPPPCSESRAGAAPARSQWRRRAQREPNWGEEWERDQRGIGD